MPGGTNRIPLDQQALRNPVPPLEKGVKNQLCHIIYELAVNTSPIDQAVGGFSLPTSLAPKAMKI